MDSLHTRIWHAAWKAGAQAWQATAGARTAILMYHGVVASGTLPRLWTQLERPLFAQHLRHLADHHPVVGLTELLDALDGRRSLEQGTVALTFDDGYFNVLEQAVPELRRFGIPATVFVTAGALPASGLLWFDALYDAHAEELEHAHPGVLSLVRGLKRLPDAQRKAWIERHFESLRQSLGQSLSRSLGGRPAVHPAHPRRLVDADELKRLADAPGITIGAHGLSHGLLSQMDRTQVQSELSDAKAMLEHLLFRKIDLFAWPDGAMALDPTRCMVEAGYRAALSTQLGFVMPQDDRFALRRIPLGSDQTLERFRRTLSGVGCVVAPLRQLLPV